MIDKAKKTIIFDFGNILINLEHQTCFENFRRVLAYDFSQGLPTKTELALHKYERGELNTEAFLWVLQQHKPEAEIRDIIDAWNSILGELPMSRLTMLEELRSSYNIAMLSNINDLHEIEIHKRLNKQMGISDFHHQYFDTVFYSHHIGFRKPEAACYTYVQKQLDIEAGDILFIDDLAINIAAAKAAGWQGVVHNPKEDILNNINMYIAKGIA